MYELVVIVNGRERPVFKAENRLDVELERQRHIRSLSEGVAEIREIKQGKKK
ncbi:hypothetical protein [Pseudodesulfovibrio senegalensis]|jgi:hypothetical protein|uniref:hypothetical protein n=1 Tax=Pseudodesulfovibrio senegalensis TaxID=1721087 RepID=UPI0014783565|nr:hypothetical protein [Pseudodesulfovibrio senegalensis]